MLAAAGGEFEPTKRLLKMLGGRAAVRLTDGQPKLVTEVGSEEKPARN